MNRLDEHLQSVLQASLHQAPEDMLIQCLQILIDISGATGGSILKENDGGGGLVFIQSNVPELIGVNVPWDSIAGSCVSRNRLIYTFAPSDKRHFDGVDKEIVSETRYLLSVPIPAVRNARLQAGSGARACGAVQLLFDSDIFPEFDVTRCPAEFTMADGEDNEFCQDQLADVMTILPNIALGMEILSLRTISYQVIHELKNKLIGTRSWANALREDLGDLIPEAMEEEDIVEDLELLEEAADSGSKLAVDYLQFTKVYNCDFQHADIGRLMDVTARELRAFADEMGGEGVVQVGIEVPEGLEWELDPDKMRQALYNLGKNAGEALIEHSVPEAKINLRARQEDGILQLLIEDNGNGMPKEIADNLFKAFATKKTGGTGLGLTIVKKIIDVHGGSIRCDTGPKGTSFIIQL